MGKVEIISKLPTQFIREIGENQQLCLICGGLGVKVDNNYVVTCKNCINGIVIKCGYCGEIIIKNHVCVEKRNAEIKRKNDAKKERQYNREVVRWSRSEKISLTEYEFKMVYVGSWGEYISIDNLIDRINNMKNDDQEFNPNNLLIYGVTETRISFKAGNIIENACDCLYEDAINNIPHNAKDEMQDFFDKWVEKYGKKTTTYDVCYKFGILI